MTDYFVPEYPDPLDANPEPTRLTPTKLDAGIMAASFNLSGVVAGCAVTAQAVPDLTVSIDAGVVQSATTELYVSGISSYSLPTPDTDYDRFDLIVVDSTGAIQTRTQTADGSTSFPQPTTGDVVLAAVYVPANAVEIDQENITDKRAIMPGTDYPGDIKMTARLTAPAGWLICDGAAYSRTDYAALFNAIGTSFGAGDGSTTFNIPNFTGRFPQGPTITDNAVPTAPTKATTGGGFDSSGNIAATAPASIAAGDLLVAIVSWNSTQTFGGGVSLRTPTIPGFTLNGSLGIVQSNQQCLAVFTKKATASEPSTYNVNCGGYALTNDAAAITILRIAGQHPTLPVDIVASITGAAGSTTLAVPSVTTNHANELIIDVAAVPSSKSQTESKVGTGTEQSDFQVSTANGSESHAVVTFTVATAGATGADTHTFSANSTDRVGATIAIRPSVSTVVAATGGVASHSISHAGRGGGTNDTVTTIDGGTGTLPYTQTIDNQPPWISLNFIIKT